MNWCEVKRSLNEHNSNLNSFKWKLDGAHIKLYSHEMCHILVTNLNCALTEWCYIFPALQTTAMVHGNGRSGRIGSDEVQSVRVTIMA